MKTIKENRDIISAALAEIDAKIDAKMHRIDRRADYQILRMLARGGGNKKQLDVAELRNECEHAMAAISRLQDENLALIAKVRDYARRLKIDAKQADAPSLLTP